MFTYISTDERLGAQAKKWVDVLGIDLECENNLHHYGAYLSLVQLSTRQHHWIVDVLALKDLGPLVAVLHDRNVQKIFHDVSFDLRILHSELKCTPKNIVDTQLAAQFLGKENLGLSSLLEEYFSIKKEKKFQMADWTKRPLTPAMLAYATKDSAHLIGLWEHLQKELAVLGRLDWFLQECAHLETLELTYEQGNFFSLKGLRNLSDQHLGIAKALYDVRERLAQQVDRPVHFVMRTSLMLRSACAKPDWSTLRGVHPIVRTNAARLDACYQARPFALPVKERKRFTPEQRRRADTLELLRNTKADALGLPRHLVFPKDAFLARVLGEPDSLRPWQKEVLGFSVI